MLLSRRSVLRSTAALAASAALARASAWAAPATPAASIPIVDAHIHLFDPTRPGGIPWPKPTDTVLYKPALPARYRSLAEQQGVVAAIAVEASPLASDNEWLLQTAHSNPIMVGIIGDLDPASPDFALHLDRLRRDPLFRGIRYGNLWDRDLGAHLTDPVFLKNLNLLAQHGLLLESANPDPKLIANLLQLTKAAPDLHLVLDHLPNGEPPADATARESYLDHLKRLGEHPHVSVKGSEILHAAPGQVSGQASTDLATYKPWLDTIWGIFGEDRVFFGSDWPNSDTTAPAH